MAERVADFNAKFFYVETNPENIISAPKNAFFFRNGTDFFLNTSGDINGYWERLQYRTVILPAIDEDTLLNYEHPCELWIKTTDGFYDEFKVLMPKTGWQFFTYKNIFIENPGKSFDWIFPPPISSTDPLGTNGNRSYDESFFYFKSGSLWARTPIALYTFPSTDSGENPSLYNNLPYARSPRYLPVPPMSTSYPTAKDGEDTYDDDFYYIKSLQWKRCPLITFDPSKMTMF